MTSTFAGVDIVEDVSTSDDDEGYPRPLSDSDDMDTGGALHRTGSNASTGNSRKNSMKPVVKKPVAEVANEMSSEDMEEFACEIDRVKNAGKVGASANLSQLNLGLNVDLLKKTFTTCHLVFLTELVLSENRIVSLPNSIFDRAPNLKKIDLTDNLLSHIPISVFTLACLEVLLLDHNRITCVPATFDIAAPFDLPALVVLGLEWNKLTEFPIHVFEFANKLQKIFICENLGIRTLPPKKMFPDDRMTEIRLDNCPEVIHQFNEGGYNDRILPMWNKIYPDKVLEYVYLGSLRTAQCSEVYADLDIKYVLTAGRHLEVFLLNHMHQLELPLDDIPGEDIGKFFETAFAFIDTAVREKSGILIHCFAGLSRSVTIMMAYLMKTHHMTRDQALAMVRAARPNSQPNEGFLQRLALYEAQLASAGN